jgi:MFS family permease
MGVALSGVPGGIVVDKSLAVALAAGGLAISIGYGGLSAQFSNVFPSVVLSAALSCLIGVGSTLINSAMIKCSALSFPDNRGIATGFPIATYGLSAFLYSLAGHWLFGSDTGSFLAFLGYSTLVICLMGLPVVYLADKGSHAAHQQGIELMPYSSRMEDDVRRKDIDDSENDFNKTDVLKSSRFWILLVILGILAGLGQLYIYSCGFMVKSLLHDADDEIVRHAQSFQVSLLSICNCIGRLICGASGDFLSNRLKQQRSWIVFVPCVILLAVQILCFDLSEYNSLWITSALNGAGYGFTWSSIPQILIEFFGVSPLSFSWGFINMGTILPTFFFTHLFGSIYDSNAISDETTGARVCLRGKDCYRRTFAFSSGFAALAMAMVIWINIRPYLLTKKYQSLP